MAATMATQPAGEPPQEPVGRSPQETIEEPRSGRTVSGTVAYVTFTIRTESPTQPQPGEGQDETPPQEPQQAMLDAARQAAQAAASLATAAAALQGPHRDAARRAAQSANEAASRATRDTGDTTERGRPSTTPVLDDAELRSKLEDHRQQLEQELLAQFQKPFGRDVTVKVLAVSTSRSVEIIGVVSLAVFVVGNYVQIVGGLRQAIEETRVALRGFVRWLTGADLADRDVEARWQPGPALLELHAAEFPQPERTPGLMPRRGARLLPVIDRALLVLLVILVVIVLVLLLTRTG